VTWTVELESRARREYLKLDRTVREAITDVIDDLATEPRPPGCKRLVGRDGYRIRSGDWRILYTVTDASKLIRIFRIGHRRDIYRRN